MATASELPVDALLGGSGGDDPDDKKDVIPTIDPDRESDDGSDESSELNWDDYDSNAGRMGSDQTPFGSEDEDSLRERFTKMSLNKKNEYALKYLETSNICAERYKHLKKLIKKDEKTAESEANKLRKKEEKKMQAELHKQEMEEFISINCVFNDLRFVIRVRRSSTLGNFRSLCVSEIGLKGKDKKELRLYLGGVALHEMTPRTTIHRAGLTDGCVVHLSISGQGGGKTSMHKKKGKILTLQDFIQNKAKDMKASHTDNQMVKEAEKSLNDFMTKASEDGSGSFQMLMEKNTLDNLLAVKKILEENGSGTSEQKLRACAPFFFGDTFVKIDEQFKSSECVVSVMKSAIEYAWTQAMVKDTKYSLTKFKSALDNAISFKNGVASTDAMDL